MAQSYKQDEKTRLVPVPNLSYNKGSPEIIDMQNLINQLTSSTMVTDAHGSISYVPPSALALRAARTLITLNNQVQLAQANCATLVAELEKTTALYTKLKEMYDSIGTIQSPDSTSVCEGGREATDVGNGDGRTSVSTPSGDGSDATTNSSNGGD